MVSSATQWRLRKIFLLLVLFALILVGAFFLSKLEKGQGLAPIFGFGQEKKCSVLNEEDCYRDQNCQGAYSFADPYCQENVCAEADWNPVFEGCRKIDKKYKEKAEIDSFLCHKTGGGWLTNKYRKLGFCNCPTFDEVKGCVAVAPAPNRVACQRSDGVWDENIEAANKCLCPERRIFEEATARCVPRK